MPIFQSIRKTVVEILHHITLLAWGDLPKKLLQRIRNDHLSLTAGSLTFTSLIAVVPLFTLILAILSLFPSAIGLQTVVQKWLVSSLVPENISITVMNYLVRFSGKALKLGLAGFVILVITACAMVHTLDQTFNRIWHVRKKRPLGQKIMIYWAILTIGPVFLAATAGLTGYLVKLSHGVSIYHHIFSVILSNLFEILLMLECLVIAFRVLPFTYVKWSHAWVGAIFSTFFMELTKKLLVVYLHYVPTYSKIYGAFSVIPILLIWIYLAWLLILLGGEICAHLPYMMQTKTMSLRKKKGWQFTVGLRIIKILAQARTTSDKNGLTQAEISLNLKVSTLDIEPILDDLCAMDWVAQLDEIRTDLVSSRYVLLIDTKHTDALPLIRKLLLADTKLLDKLSTQLDSQCKTICNWLQ